MRDVSRHADGRPPDMQNAGQHDPQRQAPAAPVRSQSTRRFRRANRPTMTGRDRPTGGPRQVRATCAPTTPTRGRERGQVWPPRTTRRQCRWLAYARQRTATASRASRSYKRWLSPCPSSGVKDCKSNGRPATSSVVTTPASMTDPTPIPCASARRLRSVALDRVAASPAAKTKPPTSQRPAQPSSSAAHTSRVASVRSACAATYKRWKSHRHTASASDTTATPIVAADATVARRALSCRSCRSSCPPAKPVTTPHAARSKASHNAS